MLTPRENLFKVLNHEQPEWIPVTTHVDPYNQPSREGIDPGLDKALGTVTWGDSSTRIIARYLGLDVMDFFGPPISVRRRRVSVQRIERDGGWINVFQTPHGDLQEAHKIVRQDGTSYCVEHLVKSKADLRALASLFDDETYYLADQAAETVRARKNLVGEQGLIRCYLPGTPLGMMVRVYAGVETLAYLWADCREELHQLFQVMGERYVEQFKLAASLGYDLLYGTDDTSTSCISPAMFEEFCLGYTDHVADAVHALGSRYVHHSCGLICNLLDLYRQTRIDAVDALTLKPVGDIERLSQAKEKLGNRITIITSPGSMNQADSNRTDMAADIRTLFADAAPGDHVIFCLAGYPHINMADMQFIAAEHKKYQRLYST